METERPILFSGDMVRALLDGRKTQTRRVMKPQIDLSDPVWLLKAEAIPLEKQWRKMREPHEGYHIEENMWGLFNKKDRPGDDLPYTGLKCPYGKPGDELWVGEAFLVNNGALMRYAADCTDEFVSDCAFDFNKPEEMAQSLSRIQLRVTGVRVERLLDISNADAIAEGYESASAFLAGEWAAKHGMENPWVWVIEFEKVA